mmetsp:Transcript_35918/g.106155  ORF Transcript_35918/g.106155 Transcript_35918/m.106155 type:complete len:209 (-) Transcript_35918:828-1454(-)
MPTAFAHSSVDGSRRRMLDRSPFTRSRNSRSLTIAVSSFSLTPERRSSDAAFFMNCVVPSAVGLAPRPGLMPGAARAAAATALTRRGVFAATARPRRVLDTVLTTSSPPLVDAPPEARVAVMARVKPTTSPTEGTTASGAATAARALLPIRRLEPINPPDLAAGALRAGAAAADAPLMVALLPVWPDEGDTADEVAAACWLAREAHGR